MDDSPQARLIQTVIADFEQIRGRLGIPRLDAKIVSALRSVPRDVFVDELFKEYAWDNRPLAIGHGQTISQPFIVALMTALIQPKKTDRVLEIGTGSGYQAAVLSGLVKEVYTIERIEPLAEEARARLAALGCSNVHVHCGDGYDGLPEYAPYDAVIVTAGAKVVPPPLIEQLASPGRCVIPIEERLGKMDLRLLEKSKTAKLSERSTIPVVFVPFVHSKHDA